MKNVNFVEAVAAILKEDARYSAESYQFIREALDFATQKRIVSAHDVEHHIKGQELLEGIRRYALQEYGAITMTVLKSWGIVRCEDFGQIVFNLVNSGVLKKTEEDTIHDFEGGYDFDLAFRKPFQPQTGK